MTSPDQAEKSLTKKAQEAIAPLRLKMNQVARTDSVFNTQQVQAIFNTTRAKYKYNRPAKGGGEWTYVRASYMKRILDSLFGFNWDFEVETTLSEAFEIAKVTKTCVVKGILTGRVKFDGQWITLKKTQWGRADVKFKKNSASEPLDFGNDMKAATTDAFKKCASFGLGIAADVYDPQEFTEVEIVSDDTDLEKEAHTKAKVEEAKKTLEEHTGSIKEIERDE